MFSFRKLKLGDETVFEVFTRCDPADHHLVDCKTKEQAQQLVRELNATYKRVMHDK